MENEQITINKKEKWFKMFRFAAQAFPDKTSMHEHLKFLKVEEQKVVCSDAQRLHIAYGPHPCKTGFYRVVKNVVLSPL